MAEYYKFEIANWNEGTSHLTLEQEAAYLRVVNAIRLSDQPIAFNSFALCGLWRCNERKAKRLLGELTAAGKLKLEAGKIVNEKAVNDASNLRRLRADRASAGSRGGIESGKSRSKALKNNETYEAIASTREEKRREETLDTSLRSESNGADAPPDPVKIMFEAGRVLLVSAGSSPDAAGKILGKWRRDFGAEAVIVALGRAKREGAIHPISFCEAVLKSDAKTRASPGIKMLASGKVLEKTATGEWVEALE